MTRSRSANIAQSVLDRLKHKAVAEGRTVSEIRELYALERFLHRLGRSVHRSRFVLKGALLFQYWFGIEARPTRDIDLACPKGIDAASFHAVLEDLLSLKVIDDGILFDLKSIQILPIRIHSHVAGLRAKFDGRIGNSAVRYQVDVGIGDEIYPPPMDIVLARSLDFPTASIKAITPYSAIAEKTEAAVVLGEANSRMKDFYDLYVLGQALDLEGSILTESIRATFRARGTLIPEDVPDGLSPSFAEMTANGTRWNAFLRKTGLKNADPEFVRIIEKIRNFILPALEAARENETFSKVWTAGGPWRSRKKR